MNEQERRTLSGGLLRISGSRNEVRPVELTVVVQSEVRPWRYPPTCDFLYGEWLCAEYETGQVPQPEPMADLALLITMARAGDHPLTGPRPAQVLDPVPQADLVRASVAGIPGLLDDLDSDTRNVRLLTGRRPQPESAALGILLSWTADRTTAMDRTPSPTAGSLTAEAIARPQPLAG